MALTVTLDGITFALAPEVQQISDEGARLVGTISGGALLWRGRRRQRLHLRGQGLTTADRDHIEALASAQQPAPLELGAELWNVVLVKVERGPTIGSDRWTLEIDAIVVSVIPE